jgi:hypothetical protein
MKDVEKIEVIRTQLTKRGDGIKTRLRIVEQFWSLDGTLLAENDPCYETVDKSAV